MSPFINYFSSCCWYVVLLYWLYVFSFNLLFSVFVIDFSFCFSFITLWICDNCGCWEFQEFHHSVGNPNLTGSQRQFEMSFTSVGLWKWGQIYKHGLCLMSFFFWKSAMKSRSTHFWKPKGKHWLTMVTPWMGDRYVQGFAQRFLSWKIVCSQTEFHQITTVWREMSRHANNCLAVFVTEGSCRQQTFV